MDGAKSTSGRGDRVAGLSLARRRSAQCPSAPSRGTSASSTWGTTASEGGDFNGECTFNVVDGSGGWEFQEAAFTEGTCQDYCSIWEGWECARVVTAFGPMVPAEGGVFTQEDKDINVGGSKCDDINPRFPKIEYSCDWPIGKMGEVQNGGSGPLDYNKPLGGPDVFCTCKETDWKRPYQVGDSDKEEEDF